jgi:hypothetical protein
VPDFAEPAHPLDLGGRQLEKYLLAPRFGDLLLLRLDFAHGQQLNSKVQRRKMSQRTRARRRN